MAKEDLIAGFNSLRKSITEEEKIVLQKIVGKTKPNLEIETFFQNLRTYEAVYKFPYWNNLTIYEKELLGEKVYSWYLTLIMFAPEFGKQFCYTYEDDLKLQIIIKGSNLQEKSDYVNYNYYLNERLQECYDRKLSAECIKWIEIEIEKTKQRMDTLINTISDKKNTNTQFEKKPFSAYLLYNEREKLAEQLKKGFIGEKGKSIRLMIEVLKEKGILSLSKGGWKKFYDSLKDYFDSDIGTYNSIFSRDPGKSNLEKSKKQAIEERIDYILNIIKPKKC
ncbi:MAG: hypothetical protein JXB49_01065 [Bacteroidales bacterium]|nr:hypothetical protein [Bacteroidales bacterium]